jgi:hypothetical protein
LVKTANVANPANGANGANEANGVLRQVAVAPRRDAANWGSDKQQASLSSQKRGLAASSAEHRDGQGLSRTGTDGAAALG